MNKILDFFHQVANFRFHQVSMKGNKAEVWGDLIGESRIFTSISNFTIPSFIYPSVQYIVHPSKTFFIHPSTTQTTRSCPSWRCCATFATCCWQGLRNATTKSSSKDSLTRCAFHFVFFKLCVCFFKLYVCFFKLCVCFFYLVCKCVCVYVWFSLSFRTQ